jgi:hypothetical protein
MSLEGRVHFIGLFGTLRFGNGGRKAETSVYQVGWGQTPGGRRDACPYFIVTFLKQTLMEQKRGRRKLLQIVISK